MLVFQTNPVGIELFSYVNAFFCSNKFAYILATWVKTIYIIGESLNDVVYCSQIQISWNNKCP